VSIDKELFTLKRQQALADQLQNMERKGADVDSPEGARWVQMSDTLATELSKLLRKGMFIFSGSRERKHLAVLEKRLAHLQERVKGRPDLTYDREEIGTLRWVLETLGQEVGDDDS
jgi:hypothetical protein